MGIVDSVYSICWRLVALVLCCGVCWADASDRGWMTVPSRSTNAAERLLAELPSETIVSRAGLLSVLPPLSAPAAVDLSLAQGLPASDFARIGELAKGLDYNPWRCFEFVRDNIRFVSYFGIVRGPERTLIDGEGNDADQALLLYALLKASGRTDLHLVFTAGQSSQTRQSYLQVPLRNHDGQTPYNVLDWLGLDADASLAEVDDVLSRGVIASSHVVVDGVDHVRLSHFSVLCEGVLLDPSFKPAGRAVPRNALSDMSYSRTGLESYGGRLGANSVSGCSTNGISSYLKARCTQLLNKWTNANERATYFVGRTKAVGQVDELPCHGSSTGWYDFLQLSDAQKELYRQRAVVSLGTAWEKSFYLDEVGDREIWLSFHPIGSTHCRADLYLGNAELVHSTALSDGLYPLAIDVSNALSSSEGTYRISCTPGNVYAIPVGFSCRVSGGMRTIAAERLAAAGTQGTGGSSDRSRALALWLAGNEWMSQTSFADRLAGDVLGGSRQRLYAIGVCAQESSPYVDVKNLLYHDSPSAHALSVGTLFASALEHAVLNQLNPPGVPAVSTVQVLSLANAQGASVYYVNASNVAGVLPLLEYSDSLKTELRGLVDSGKTLLVPQRDVSLNSWTGYGYEAFGQAGAERYSEEMAISGGLGGGYATTDYLVESERYESETIAASRSNGAVPQAASADPVAMPSGAFTDAAVDIHVPGGERGLAWTRRYDSRLRHSDGSLGRGWTHAFEASADDVTDPEGAFGAGAVGTVVPTVVAMAVADDLLSASRMTNKTAAQRARYLLMAALVVQWWTEQYVERTVAVKAGEDTLFFYRFPNNGVYVPFPGVTAELGVSNGGYVLGWRDGRRLEFDSGGRLSRLVDEFGAATTILYDSQRRPYRITRAQGERLDLTWGSDGRISRVAGNGGTRVDYRYDAAGLLTNVSDVARSSWRFAYDADGRLTTETNPLGSLVVSNAYDALGRVSAQTAETGGEWKFGYVDSVRGWDETPFGDRRTRTFDRDGRVLREDARDGTWRVDVYDGHGHSVSSTNLFGRIESRTFGRKDDLLRNAVEGTSRRTDYVYDRLCRVVEATNALGGVTHLQYDAKSRIVRTTLPNGGMVTNLWNAAGLLLKQFDIAPDGSETRRTEWTYSQGLPQSRTVYGMNLPPSGVSEYYAYDACRNMTSRTDAVGRTSCLSYDSRGNVITNRAPDGARWIYAYDAMDNLVSETDPLGRVTTRLYTPSGALASVFLPDGGVETNVYDALDRLVWSRDARGLETSLVYDRCDRLLRTQDAYGWSSTSYNKAGLPSVTTNRAGVVWRTRYDAAYSPIACSNLYGRAYWPTADGLGRVTRVQDSDGLERRMAYDEVGRTVERVRPSGARERFAYDGLGRLASVTNAEGRVYSVVYDAMGRALSAADACGRTVFTALYDGTGDVLARTDGAGRTTGYSYDVCGRLAESVLPCGERIAFEYDSVGNVVVSSNGVAQGAFAYDACDRLTNAVTRVGDATVTNAWIRDLGGLVTNVVYGAGRSVTRELDLRGRPVAISDWLGHRWTFTWDAGDRPTGGTSPDGAVRSFAYDAAGGLVSWRSGSHGGRAILRDFMGRRLQDTVTAGPMPRLSKVRNAQNVFDASDRLVSARVAYGNASRPVEEVYSYDACGALTNVLSGTDVVFRAAFDDRGLVSSVNGRTFDYDANGLRVKIGGRIFIPDFDDPLRRPLVECDAAGEVVRYYVWGPGCLLGYVDAGGTLTVAHADEQGSVIALTDASGVPSFTACYGPHGEDWGTTGTNPTPFAWLGGFGVVRGCSDERLGTFYLTRHRLYSPVLQRFLSPDPLGLEGGLNLYAYAAGNPLAAIDPLGLCAQGSEFGAYISGFFSEMADYWTNDESYMMSSVRQFVLGNGTDEATGLGTAMQLAGGFTGVDLPMDIRDLAYDLSNWQPTWGHVHRTGVDAIALIPVVGVAKAVGRAGKMAKAAPAARKLPGPILKTSSAARAAAKENGWTLVKGARSKDGELVFTDNKRFYSRDNTSHKGGVWKELDSHFNRIGTLDAKGNRIAE